MPQENETKPSKPGLKVPDNKKPPPPKKSVNDILSNSQLYTMEEEEDEEMEPPKPEPQKKGVKRQPIDTKPAKKAKFDAAVPVPMPVGKRKIKKITSKTYLDERGKLVTEDVEEYVTDEEAPDAPKVIASKTGQQGNLMSFFKKS